MQDGESLASFQRRYERYYAPSREREKRRARVMDRANRLSSRLTRAVDWIVRLYLKIALGSD